MVTLVAGMVVMLMGRNCDGGDDDNGGDGAGSNGGGGDGIVW